MSEKLEVIKAEDYGLEKKTADKMVKGLTTILEERDVLAESYKAVMALEITEETIPEFKQLRLRIRDNRSKGIEQWHKTNKAFYLAGGRFVDAIKNKETAENQRMEEALHKAEKHFENLEIERLRELNKERVEILLPYDENAGEMDLGGLDDEMWEILLEGKQRKHKERLEAEKKAKEEVQEAAAQAAKELAKAKAAAAKARKEKAAEKKKADAEKAKAAEVAKAAAEKAKAALEKERAAKAKIEAELAARKAKAAKKEADEKAAADAKAAKAKALAAAPIKKQLTVWVDSFTLPVAPIKNTTSVEIEKTFLKFAKYAKGLIAKIE